MIIAGEKRPDVDYDALHPRLPSRSTDCRDRPVERRRGRRCAAPLRSVCLSRRLPTPFLSSCWKRWRTAFRCSQHASAASRYQVNDDCGVLVEPGDAAGLAAAVDDAGGRPERLARNGPSGAHDALHPTSLGPLRHAPRCRPIERILKEQHSPRPRHARRA